MKVNIPRAKQSIEIWNVCECGEMLTSIYEGKRGICSMCWVKNMPSDTKSAINKIISAAFKKDKPSYEEKDQLIDDVLSKLKRDDLTAQ